jgi:prepilin-type N-terminal cleavage/methylation domain-containing protein
MKPHHHTKGFTLIETVVAILILSLTVGALLTLTANSIFSVRYARNQIVANNLAQESLEYIRNSRDTARQQHIVWTDWLKTLNVDYRGVQYDLTSPHGCFLTTSSSSPKGCIVSPYTPANAPIWEMTYAGSCTGQPSATASCPSIWFYSATGFYSYPSRDPDTTLTNDSLPVRTSFIRWINTSLSPDQSQLTVTVTMEWYNGINKKTLTQSMILTNWAQ